MVGPEIVGKLSIKIVAWEEWLWRGRFHGIGNPIQYIVNAHQGKHRYAKSVAKGHQASYLEILQVNNTIVRI